MSIPQKLRTLSLEMKQLGINMVCTGHPEAVIHGEELINAGEMAESWARELDALELF
jgi:hypothetical protein